MVDAAWIATGNTGVLWLIDHHLHRRRYLSQRSIAVGCSPAPLLIMPVPSGIPQISQDGSACLQPQRAPNILARMHQLCYTAQGKPISTGLHALVLARSRAGPVENDACPFPRPFARTDLTIVQVISCAAILWRLDSGDPAYSWAHVNALRAMEP